MVECKILIKLEMDYADSYNLFHLLSMEKVLKYYIYEDYQLIIELVRGRLN